MASKKRETRTVTVTLEVEGTAEDVSTVIGAVLDNGEFQDAINTYAEDMEYDVVVQDATLSEVGG